MAHNYKTRNYNKGTSLVLINTDNGRKLFDFISDEIFYEKSELEYAMKGNKCLSEPFSINTNELSSFWNDYEAGLSIYDLNEKYCANTYVIPKDINLRRIYYKWKWIIKK